MKALQVTKAIFFALYCFFITVTDTVYANEVKIVRAELVLINAEDNAWNVSVTLEHADTGWEHYANEWRVVDKEGNVIATRILHHPHVDEQPFTRSLSAVEFPLDQDVFFIQAKDNVHGLSSEQMPINLKRAKDGKLIETMRIIQ